MARGDGGRPAPAPGLGLSAQCPFSCLTRRIRGHMNETARLRPARRTPQVRDSRPRAVPCARPARYRARKDTAKHAGKNIAHLRQLGPRTTLTPAAGRPRRRVRDDRRYRDPGVWGSASGTGPRCRHCRIHRQPRATGKCAARPRRSNPWARRPALTVRHRPAAGSRRRPAARIARRRTLRQKPPKELVEIFRAPPVRAGASLPAHTRSRGSRVLPEPRRVA